MPVRVWPLVRAREAFRFMSQARHTGKLVLDVPPVLDPEGTVLVTGGTGCVGGLVAAHVVGVWQVRRLLLVSRRGLEAPGARELVGRLGELGARVSVVAGDVSDPVVVEEVLGRVDPAHPLTGVVHAAGVLDDAVVTSQTPETLARVWAAKATAAANLHTATKDLRLAMFVMFSSAAATLGSPGQANYAAANAYCDALAAHRHAQGLPALSIAWGLWHTTSDMTGHLNHTDHARMRRTGFTPLSSQHALTLLDAAHEHGHPHLVAVDLDTHTLTTHPTDTLPTLLRTLFETAGSSRPTATAGQHPADLASRLATLSLADQRHHLVSLVRTHAATVLGHTDSGGIHLGGTFKELGFDSLTAVELRNRLAGATGLRLPAGLIFDHPNAVELADYLRQQLAPTGDSLPGQDRTDPVLRELAKFESALSAVTAENLDSEAVTARLESLLARWKAAGAATVTESATERLQVASADQVLEFIDKELGV